MPEPTWQGFYSVAEVAPFACTPNMSGRKEKRPVKPPRRLHRALSVIDR